jgi:hypothetical protein
VYIPPKREWIQAALKGKTPPQLMWSIITIGTAYHHDLSHVSAFFLPDKYGFCTAR